MKRFYANGRSMAQILGWIKPGIGEGEEERAEALYKKRLSRLQKMEADQKGGKVLSTGRFLHDGRNDEHGGGYVISNGEMPNRVRHDGKGVGDVQVKADLSIPMQTNTSFIPYITSVSKQCLPPMAYGLRLITVLIFSLCLLNSALAQSRLSVGTDARVEEAKPLLVGQQVPEDFWDKEHLFYLNGDTVRRNLRMYKGKTLLIGFWATWCSSCLKNSPRIEEILTKKGGEISYVKVNSQKTMDNLEKINQLLKGSVGKIYGLSQSDFSSIVYDAYLQAIFPNHGYPLYVLIGRNGTVQIMTFRNLFDESFHSLFSGGGI